MQEYSADLGFVSNLLSDCASLANLSYETLVEAQQTDTLAPQLRSLIADTDLKFRALRPITSKRLLPDWRTSVLNWQKVETTVRTAGVWQATAY